VCAVWLQAYEWRCASIQDVISRFPEHHHDIIAEFTISFVVVVVDDGNLARRRRGCRGRAAGTKQFGITFSVLLLPFCMSTIQPSTHQQLLPSYIQLKMHRNHYNKLRHTDFTMWHELFKVCYVCITATNATASVKHKPLLKYN